MSSKDHSLLPKSVKFTWHADIRGIKRRGMIESPMFSPKNICDYKLQIFMYENSHDDCYYQLFLQLQPDKVIQWEIRRYLVEFKISAETSNHVKIASWSSETFFKFPYDQALNNNFLNKLSLVNNSWLTICAEVSLVRLIASSVQKVLDGDTVFNSCSSVPYTFDDLSKLLENEKYSDIEIRVRDAKVKAHQVILAARSVVFKAMFTHDTPEKRSGIVQITDLDIKIVRKMLKCMYTGIFDCVELYDSIDLLKAADKYDIDCLRKQCESHLIRCLNDSNVLMILSVSDMHDCKELKQKAIELICSSRKNLKRMVEDINLIGLELDQNQRTRLVNEILLEGMTKLLTD